MNTTQKKPTLKKMKKTILLTVVVFLCVVQSHSQENLNYQKELERMVKVPNNPEATAFTKYGNTSVSMYSGTPNISIPLYSIQGRELSLPISLTYDASGVKVDQSASQVGLNWNLNLGGRVSRITNGLVDDYISIAPSAVGYSSMYSNNYVYVGGMSTNKTLRGLVAEYLNNTTSFETENDVLMYFKFLKDVSDNKLDTQPDYFSFSALGYSDTFVFEIDNVSTNAPKTFRSLNNPRNKINATFNGNHVTKWTITVEDGTKFFFEQAEKTHTINLNDINGASAVYQDYYSSWLLTKIESANLKDIYEFNYTNLGLSSNQPQVHISSRTNEVNDDNPNYTGNITKQSTDYQVEQIVLTGIKHNDKLVVGLTYKNRYDHSKATALDKINVYKYRNTNVINDEDVLKSFDFSHSYFGITNNQLPQTQDPFDIRLKLDSFSIKSNSNSILKSYTFDYFSPDKIPARDSYSKDYLGYYNGTNNSVLYPSVYVGGINFTGANRSPNFSKAIIGTLKRITYPTGGYTDFTFEANTTPYNNSDISSSVQDVTYGSLSITGGHGNPSDCGNCCMDQHGTAPKIGTSLFNITEAGNYDISYSNTSMGGEAYLTKRAQTLNYSNPLNYNQIIDQSSCNELIPIIWSNFYGSDGDRVYLTPGTYQITLIKPYFVGGSGSSSLRVHREEATSNGSVGTGSVARAGIRVKSIKDYSSSNILSTEKEYQYSTILNGSSSSGKILFEIPFYVLSNYVVHITQPTPSSGQVYGLNTLTTMTRVNSWSGGNRPHIAYPTVFEIQKGVNANGYIKHSFNTGSHSGIYSSGVSPSVNLYSNDFQTGKEYQTDIYDKDNSLIKSSKTRYENPSYFGNSTLYIHNNALNRYQFIDIYVDRNNKYRYRYIPAVFKGFSGALAPGTAVNPAPPSSCGNCILSLDYSTLEKRQTYAQGRSGGVLSSENTTYDDTDEITTSTTNFYDSTIDYLLRETTTKNSKGESINTKQYYPKDFTTEPYTSMVTANRLTEVLQSKVYKKNELLSNRKNTYMTWGSKILPARIETAKGSNGLETRIKFHSYYSNGNLKEVSQKDGTSTIYIWGYNGKHVVAKIDNATYKIGDPNIITSSQESLINNVISAANNEYTSVDENNLRTKLELLRSGFPKAQITSYTYDPLIGVTSITDPRGRTVFYEYDEFNRLKFVKDQEGNILNENQYNYKN